MSFSRPTEEERTLVKPQVRELAARGDVSWPEWQSLAMNSYERATLKPSLDLRALHELGKMYLHHTVPSASWPSTYEEILVQIYLPALLTRIQGRFGSDEEEAASNEPSTTTATGDNWTELTRDIPDDFHEATEVFKLAIARRRASDYDDVDRESVRDVLRALLRLVD